VTADGTPPQLCTFRAGRRCTLTAKPPAACGLHRVHGGEGTQFRIHGCATKWRMISNCVRLLDLAAYSPDDRALTESGKSRWLSSTLILG
jgi:hypothetical protein